MKFLHFLTGRLFVTIVLITIQAAWCAVFFLKLLRYAPWISIFFGALSILIILFIISKDENPTYKIGWILIIGILPLLGGLLYLVFGNKRPSRRMQQKLNSQQNRMASLRQQQPEILKELSLINSRRATTSFYVARRSLSPVWKNTQTEYYPIGEALYADLLTDLEKAEHFIFLEYFIIAKGKMWNSILDILIRKAAAGVDVRLIYDDMGCLDYLPGTYYRELEQKGIKALAFNPFVPFLSLAMNHRDHRKMVVIDGHTAFSGGINLADEYINAYERFGHWKDTGIRLYGDAVWNYTMMFLEMWNAFRKTDLDFEQFAPHTHHPAPFASDGFVQPFSDSPLDDETTAENVYLEVLAQASDYVYIFTPYLVIDNEMQTALCLAARRGVDVRLVTPGIPDKKMVYRLTRSYYPPLLKAGVRIYEYTPGFLHAKSYVSDDKLAVVGTINMDYRSLYLHFECGTILYDTSTIMQVKQDSLQTIAQSQEVTLDRYKHQGFFYSLWNAILRVAAPML